MAKETSHKLKTPVQFGSETIEQVTISRKLKFLRGCTVKAGADAKGGVSIDLDYGTLIDLGSKMIGQPAAVLDDMDEDDQSIIIQAANDFLLKHLGAGTQR